MNTYCSRASSSVMPHYEKTLRRLKEFTTSETVNQVRKSRTATDRMRTCAQTQRLAPAGGLWQRQHYWCRSTKHLANSTSCKARDKCCLKCNKIGHFQAVCRVAKFEQCRRSKWMGRWKHQALTRRSATVCSWSWSRSRHRLGCSSAVFGRHGLVSVFIMEDSYAKQCKAAAALRLPPVTLS